MPCHDGLVRNTTVRNEAFERFTLRSGEILGRGLRVSSYTLLGQTGVTLVLRQLGPRLSATLIGIEGAEPLQPHVRAFVPSQLQRPSTASIYLPESGRTLELSASSGGGQDDSVRFEIISKDPKGNGVSARFRGNGYSTELTGVSAVHGAPF